MKEGWETAKTELPVSAREFDVDCNDLSVWVLSNLQKVASFTEMGRSLVLILQQVLKELP